MQDALPEEVIIDALDPVEENMQDSASSAGSVRTDEDFDLPLKDDYGETPDTRISNRESDKTGGSETDKTKKSGGTRGSDVP